MSEGEAPVPHCQWRCYMNEDPLRHLETPTEKLRRITRVIAKVVIHQPLVSPGIVTSDCPPMIDRTRDRCRRLSLRFLLSFPLHLKTPQRSIVDNHRLSIFWKWNREKFRRGEIGVVFIEINKKIKIIKKKMLSRRWHRGAGTKVTTLPQMRLMPVHPPPPRRRGSDTLTKPFDTMNPIFTRTNADPYFQTLFTLYDHFLDFLWF